MTSACDCGALFLFSPGYAAENPQRVAARIDRIAALRPERDIALTRLDMIMVHDVFARLGDIRKRVLVICGSDDFCTPLHMSKDIAQAISDAELLMRADGGHFIYLEQERAFFDEVPAFVGRHRRYCVRLQK